MIIQFHRDCMSLLKGGSVKSLFEWDCIIILNYYKLQFTYLIENFDSQKSVSLSCKQTLLKDFDIKSC